MATQNNIHVPDELLAALEAKAAEKGTTVDELAAETLRAGLEDQTWRDILEYGRQTGTASGHAEADVPDLVKAWRRDQRTQ